MRVDRFFEHGDLRLAHAGAGKGLVHLRRIGRGELGADGEQVALDGLEQRALKPLGHLDDRHAERGVQLVDLAVRFDARVVFGDAVAAEQSGVAPVALLRVDPRHFPSSPRPPPTALYGPLPSPTVSYRPLSNSP